MRDQITSVADYEENIYISTKRLMAKYKAVYNFSTYTHRMISSGLSNMIVNEYYVLLIGCT